MNAPAKKNEMVLEVETFPNMATLVNFLFGRLHTVYTAAWKRQIEGVPESDLKSNWGYELAWTFGKPEVIRYALENLPERPPNAIEFRNLCRKAPVAKAPDEADFTKPAHPSVIKAVLAQHAPAPTGQSCGWQWARDAVRRHEAGDRIGVYALKSARQALIKKGEMGEDFEWLTV